MLAIITKMTLTQVSTWFANARRRLKKENKMTWEPKNKTDDDDDAMVSDDDKDKDELDEKTRDHHKGETESGSKKLNQMLSTLPNEQHLVRRFKTIKTVTNIHCLLLWTIN